MRVKRRTGWRFLLLGAGLVLFGCNFPGAVATPGPPATPSPSAVTPSPSFSAHPSPLPPALAPGETPLPIPSSSETARPPATIAYQPVFEPSPCAFPAPAGTRPECGYLVVPENRADPQTRFIRLHVAVFRSTAADRAPDPVVHLAGGPGSSSLGVAGYLFERGLGAILERRDFILFDQRGTGYSLPLVDCPEREELAPTLLEGHLPPGESVQAIVAAFRECRDRLRSEGVDLAAYRSVTSAADLQDLRLALGYEQLNLYGVSYGTRLALTVLRDFPQTVRSAVLDSTYPPQVNLYTFLAPNAARAFAALFSRCAADPECHAHYPHLEAVFYGLVDELNSRPVQVTMTIGGVERAIRLDGNLLIDVLFVGLYHPAVTAAMPKMIYAIRRGDTDILQERLALYFDDSSALGMQMAVQCGEEIPFATPQEAFAAARGEPPQIAAFFPESVRPLFDICREWGLPAPDPRENQPVTSAVPALVLAGEFDPITPPDWGRMAASTLSQGYFYEFPANGHWVTRSSSCALAMALAFWEDPTQPPDATCITRIEGIRFR